MSVTVVSGDFWWRGNYTYTAQVGWRVWCVHAYSSVARSRTVGQPWERAHQTHVDVVLARLQVGQDHGDRRSALKNVCPLYTQDKVSPPLCGTVLKKAAKTRNTRPHKARREESWQNLSLRTTYNSRSRQQGPGAARPLRRRNWTPPHRDLSVPRTASSLPTDLSPVSSGVPVHTYSRECYHLV